MALLEAKYPAQVIAWKPGRCLMKALGLPSPHASLPLPNKSRVLGQGFLDISRFHSGLLKKTQKFFSHLSRGLKQFLWKFQQDFVDTDKTILKFIEKGKGIRIAETILKMKN